MLIGEWEFDRLTSEAIALMEIQFAGPTAPSWNLGLSETLWRIRREKLTYT